MTITSKLQAVVVLENGEWYITDESQLGSTYIQVVRKRKLQKGDVIVFGNKKFRFDG
jgi:hypothetical protein